MNAAREFVWLAILLGTAGCVSSDLPIPAQDPANPQAPVSTAAPQSAALQPGFEPFEAYGVAAPPQGAAHEHAGHGAHAVQDSGSPGAANAPAKPAGDIVYVCPMHPEVRRAQPGRCPKCGMNLEPRKADDK